MSVGRFIRKNHKEDDREVRPHERSLMVFYIEAVSHGSKRVEEVHKGGQSSVAYRIGKEIV